MEEAGHWPWGRRKDTTLLRGRSRGGSTKQVSLNRGPSRWREGCGPKLPSGKTTVLGMGRQAAELGHSPRASSRNTSAAFEN